MQSLGTGFNWHVDGTDSEEEGNFLFHTATNDTVYLFWSPDEPTGDSSDCLIHGTGERDMYDVRCDIQQPSEKVLCEAG